MFFSKPILSLILISSFFIWQRHSVKNNIIKPRAYYISPSGSDKNDGTRTTPIKSFPRVKEIRLNPGDSILFEGGHDYKGSLLMTPGISGDSLHPIFLSSYGNGYASLYPGNNQGVSIYRASWLTIKKLKLIGSGRKSGNTKDGLSIVYSRHIIADDLIISGFQKSGVFIDSSENISVKNVFAHDNGFAGISVGKTNVAKNTNHNIYIGHCRVENNPGDPSNLDNHSGNGIVVSACTNVLIEYCTATNNGWDMPRKGNGPVGIWAFEADSVIIQHCLSYRNKTSAGGADGGGFDFDGGVTHSIIQYCLSYENQGAGYCIFQYLYASPWHDNIFRYNISENDGTVSDAGAGIYIWNSSRDSNQFYNSFAYNNTIYNSKAAAISYSELSERKRFVFYNNIFVARDSLIHGNKGVDIFLGNDWNSLKNGNHKEPVFKKAGHTTLTSAAGLKNFDDYKIPANSPLRNSGVHLHALFGIETGRSDFNGGKPPSAGVGASF